MKRTHFYLISCLTLSLVSTTLFAAQSQNTEMEAAQAALNKKVLARPFSSEEYQSVEVYIIDRHSRGLLPVAVWHVTDDCEALTSITDYRDCQYYKRYYAE